MKILGEHGLVSGYHEFFDEAHGVESRSTIYFYRHAHRSFHIDYIFIPREWSPHLKTVDVGEYERWSKLSGHCPVTVEIELPEWNACRMSRILTPATASPQESPVLAFPVPYSLVPVPCNFLAVVITTTLTSTSTVPKTVRNPSASPPRKYPTTTATTGFTYAYVPTFVGDS